MINGISLEMLAENLWKVYSFNRLVAIVKVVDGKMQVKYSDCSGLFDQNSRTEVSRQLNLQP